MFTALPLSYKSFTRGKVPTAQATWIQRVRNLFFLTHFCPGSFALVLVLVLVAVVFSIAFAVVDVTLIVYDMQSSLHSTQPTSNFRKLISKFALNSSEIVSRVQISEFPPFRPTVSELITGVEEIRELMKQCWEESPDLRPDFHEIKKIVNKILTNNGM